MTTATILAVDDDPANRFLLEKALREHRVLAVESADDMRRTLEAEHVDLILLDVMMPGESGFEAAAKLQEDEEHRGTPVLFLTARTAGQDVAEGFRVGGVDYIKKPFEIPELRARIDAALERRRNTEALYQQIEIDPLTGVMTRTAFLTAVSSQLSQLERRSAGAALVFVDIDDFKQVNDRYGHHSGDLVLQAVASSLSRSVREYDLVGRYGGEEFVLFFPDADLSRAGAGVHRARRYLEEHSPEVAGTSLAVTFSAGISDLSEVPAGADRIDRLMRQADQRLYQAKAAGKNRTVPA